jgi:hypothetical protein
VNVGDNSSVSEVDECVVYELPVNRAWMEDGEVGVFSARRMEVGVREGVGMQGHTIDRVSLLAASLDGHPISH